MKLVFVLARVPTFKARVNFIGHSEIAIIIVSLFVYSRNDIIIHIYGHDKITIIWIVHK
jgi:hypothetical protein